MGEVELGKTESELRDYIKEKYKSVRDFSIKSGIPYSTVDSVLKRGIKKSSVDSVIKICDALDISIEGLVNGKIVEIIYSATELAAHQHNDNQKITPEAYEAAMRALKKYVKKEETTDE